MSKQDRAPLEASEANADLRAEAATDTPADTGTTEVHYKGSTYKVDTNGDGWPIDASLAFSQILNTPDDQPMRAIEPMGVFLGAVLPPAQWAAFRRTNRTADLRGLFDAVLAQAFGAPAGE